ncbi:pentatricopeptide repeat-containing protein At1g26900, mitochondrial [Mercurialis annua]|uniref:pentatricopeptide repeat-containing protein At1g26900, mitochondrial n=1 Tax=Mercurialis annua TaxID=3986 RepID=UPI00215E6023|nr:pentatricopeptide repeat-containing protein At1g26900, mitochondrial [Mercurialis annua]
MNLANSSRLRQFNSLISLLGSCKSSSDTTQIHSFMIKTGIDRDPFAVSKLLAASSLQDLNYAASIFKHIQTPNLFMFNTLLRGHSIGSDPKQTLGVFKKLRAQGIDLDQFSFIATLKACTRALAVSAGEGVHGLVVTSGYLMFINVKNTLLHFYSVCGQSEHARKLFDEFPQLNDSVSWNALMGAYLQASQPAATLKLFRKFCRSCFRVSDATLLIVLAAFADLEDSNGGESMHGHCITIGFSSNLNVVTALIEMYAKTGHIHSGRKIFDGVVNKDVVMWNCMIDRYAKVGLPEQAVALLHLMKHEGVKPNSSTLAGLLAACSASGLIKLGRSLSKFIEEEELELNAVLGTALIDMFSKCGFLNEAIQVFDRMESKDVKCWTAMIIGYAVHGQARNAVSLLYKMEDEGFIPNDVTFLGVLSGCSHGGLVTEAMECFERMVQAYGYSPKIEHYGCVIDLLGRAGLLEEAHDLIQRLPIRSDATAWRALLAACRVYGNVELAKRISFEIDDQHPADSILLSNTYAIVGRLPVNYMSQQGGEERISANYGNRSVLGTGRSSIEILS